MKECKTCSKCKEEKNVSFFGKHGTNKDGMQFQCKACRVVTCATSYKKESPEIRTKRKAVSKRWREMNPEKYTESSLKWRLKNQATRTHLERKRNISKIKRTPSWLKEDDIDHIKCIYQLASMLSKHGNEKWHVDHIVPLQGKTVSGFHTPSNLQVIPAAFNLRKSNKYG